VRPPSVQVSGSGLAARRRWRSGDRGFHRRELSLFAGAYVVYNAARWLFTGDLSQAQWHAESIMRLERELGLAVEASVQHRLDTGLWSPFFSYVYMAAQLVVLPGSLVWLYRRAPGVYRPLRNTVLGTWLIAIPIYAIFPVAPPRLAHPGIVDAVSEQAGFALTGRSTLFFNPLAAVPSLHVGFAFAVGIAAAAALRAPGQGAGALVGAARLPRCGCDRQPLRLRHRGWSDRDRDWLRRHAADSSRPAPRRTRSCSAS
jgi:PAP2 superfamily